MMRFKHAVALLSICLAALFAPAFTKHDGITQDRTSPFEPPGTRHLLGTDGLGRDQFARVLIGTRMSLIAGAAATALALGAALVAGGLAGYYGGLSDALIMRTAELFQSLPWIYLLLGIRAFLPIHMRPASALAAISLIAGLTGWPRSSRLVRGIVMSERQRDYVVAARAYGASDAYLLQRHILPAVRSPLLVQGSLLLPQFVFAEVALSFLGLGVNQPTPTLGNLIAELRDLHVLSTFPWMLSPAVVLVAFNATMHQFTKWLK